VNSTDVVLEGADLVKEFVQGEATLQVLRGASIKVHAGERIAIVGASGSGKTTLLQLLGGLDLPTRGSVGIAGSAMNQLSDTERGRLRNHAVGFVYQFHHLLPEFTALENVTIPMRRLAKLSPREMHDRAAMLLDAVGLGNKINRPANHLSGGEQQRVAIARSLANDPKILLADEPTGNLDAENSERIFHLLTELVKREQKALLLATHNPQIARAGDFIHEMKDGIVVRSGAPSS